MALYFFDMVDGLTVADIEGREIEGGLASVRDEALEDAREMIAGAVLKGVDITGRRFEIKDSDHNLVLTVQFAEATELEHHMSANRGPSPTT